MQVPFLQVDAFGDRPFTGNPAAVCVLERWPDDGLLQSIAEENNLSETAFLVETGEGADGGPGEGSATTAAFELRWFTPTVEVDLCGHATLASGHVVLTHLRPSAGAAAFATRSGELVVGREEGSGTAGGGQPALRMDLPADPRAEVAPPPGLAAILGREPVAVLGGATWIAVLEHAAEVIDLEADVAAIGALDPPYLNVTAPGAPGSGIDFVSRFFAPGAGIDEDPVTGSAHCALVPYWAQRLGRDRLAARQVSARGGSLDCELDGDVVVLRGRCAEVIRGTLTLDGLG